MMVRVIVAALLVVPALRADDTDTAKAKAALALAQASRERAEHALTVAAPCHTDYASGVRQATEEKKPLVLWVGFTCAADPTTRKMLGDAVHAHVETWNGVATPRLVYQGPDGVTRSIPKDDLCPSAVKAMRRTLALDRPAAIEETPQRMPPAVYYLPSFSLGTVRSDCPGGNCPPR